MKFEEVYAEIVELKKTINIQEQEKAALINGQETLQKQIAEKNVDIERLKDENRILTQRRANLFEIVNAYEKGRAEAIKDFAERMKEKGHIPNEKWNTTKEKAVYESDIDNLVKELTGQ